MEPKFAGIVKDLQDYGIQFVADRPDVYFAYLQGLLNKSVEVIIRIPKDNKSLQQLRYFHGVVCRIASEASGYTMPEIKGLLKGYFLNEYIKAPDGREIAWVPSLADLKKSEMSDFIDNCITLIATHWHAVVPSPEEINY